MTSPATRPVRQLISLNLDRAISATGKTNRAIGEEIGATEHQVWRWRRGKTKPSDHYLVALAEVLFDGDIARFYEEQERAA